MEPVSRNLGRDRQSRSMPCAQCGRALVSPEWSESLDDRRVRHLWNCEACGYRFETLVCYPAALQVKAA